MVVLGDSQPIARPLITALNQPFWAALKGRQLRMPYCTECGEWIWPLASVCPTCWSRDSTWEPLSGSGVLSSWVIYHRSFTREFPDVPYNVIEVDLAEGPRIVSNLVDSDGNNLRSADGFRYGGALKPYFQSIDDEITLLKFQWRVD
jgi:uncharacterized OB-fold protein